MTDTTRADAVNLATNVLPPNGHPIAGSGIEKLCHAVLSMGAEIAELRGLLVDLSVAIGSDGDVPTDLCHRIDAAISKSPAAPTEIIQPDFDSLARNPYEQFLTGNHSVGIIKDGKLIATDAEVYKPSATESETPSLPGAAASSEDWRLFAIRVHNELTSARLAIAELRQWKHDAADQIVFCTTQKIKVQEELAALRKRMEDAQLPQGWKLKTTPRDADGLVWLTISTPEGRHVSFSARGETPGNGLTVTGAVIEQLHAARKESNG